MYRTRQEAKIERLKRLMEGDPEKGVRRLVWLPNRLDRIVEETRKSLGMRKSAFYRYAIVHYLTEIGVISEKTKKELQKK